MIKNINIDLVYQPMLTQPPMSPDQLQQNAVAGDKATITHWEKTWMDHIRKNKAYFGDFGAKSMGQLYGKNLYKPAIVVGSGPSLSENLEALRQNQALPEPLLVISCLHNYGYFKDEGIKADYWLTLDAGAIVMDDIGENRKKSFKEYMDESQDEKLLAFIGTDPKLFEAWKGEIFLFNSMIPDPRVQNEINAVEYFSHNVSSGGNALGACMYIAKVIFGSPKIILVGADFCFSYDNKFHSYSTHYDNLGQYMMWPDVFGIPRKTWGSYLNFKYWFDKISMVVPGDWCSSSYGLLGAYQGGNLPTFQYMPLEQALLPYRNVTTVKLMDPKMGEFGQMVPDESSKRDLLLKDLFSDPKYPKNIVLF